MSEAERPKKIELSEVMLAMDVVDTLRHQQSLVDRELGTNDHDLAAAINRIIELQGGAVVSLDNTFLAEIPLNIGGFMSQLKMPEIARRLEAFQEAVVSLGSTRLPTSRLMSSPLQPSRSSA